VPTVATDVICCWPDTVALIPAGWSRESNLDSCYVQGAPGGLDGDLSTSRGNASHNHTSPAHTPIQNSHFHNFQTTSGPDLTQAVRATGSLVASETHTHDIKSSATAIATNIASTMTVNNSTDNHPPYRKVIFIKSGGAATGIPAGAYAFFVSDTFPTNWARVEQDNYLLGAAAGAGGSGTGGAVTHIHTEPGHTHTQNSHSHTNTTSYTEVGTANVATTGGSAITLNTTSHTHSVQIGAAAVATNQSYTVTINATNQEPLWKKLNIIKNNNAGADFPTNIICMWGGLNSAIPADWSRYTAMDGYFLKGCANDTEVGVNGGSQAHSHTTTGCAPTQDGHDHGGVGTDLGGSGTISRRTGTGAAASLPAHIHTWSVTTKTATNNSITVAVDDCASEAAYPPYRRVIFIQYSPAGAAVTPYRTLMGAGV